MRHDDVERMLAHGDLPGAELRLRALLRTCPDDAHAWFLLSRAVRAGGDADAERVALREANRHAPRDPRYAAQLALRLAEDCDAAAASELLDAVLANDTADERALDVAAAALARLDRHRHAAEVLRVAVARGGRNAAILFNLATALKYCGDFAGAEQALLRALALQPRYHKARTALTIVRPATAERNQIADYRALLAELADPITRLQISHALARELDALGRYAEAFDTLAAGKAAVMQATGYTFAQDERLFRALLAAAPPTPAPRAADGIRPIFIVGLPRSGTTVVERIVNAHPQTVSVGESLQMSYLLQRHSGARSMHLLDPDAIPALSRAPDLGEVGRRYLARVARSGDPRRPVDKFHLNSIIAGYVAAAIPDARIVVVVRDAMDTIASNYRQVFEYRTALYRFNLSVASAARFYLGFRRLVDHWTAAFPANMHVLSYERLVRDPVGEGRALFDFCELPWDDRFARIEDNAAPVTTASATQVRRPIGTGTIGQWRRYADHLEPALRIVREAGFTV